MDTLASYLEKNGLRQSDFAEVVGVGQAMISRLTRKEVKPSLEVAIAIERATNGAVPASYWVDDAPEAGAAQ